MTQSTRTADELIPALAAGSLALIGEAERAILAATTATEAEDVWLRVRAVEEASRLMRASEDVQVAWARTKHRAERRWGELLPPVETGRPEKKNVTDRDVSLTGAERNARQKAREVAKVPDEKFEKFLQRKDPDQLTRAKLLRVAREVEAEKRRAQPVEEITESGDVATIHGDLRTALDHLTRQVDAIITDPPYPVEFLDEFDALGELAAELLTPTGVLAVMVGQSHLPSYLERLGAHVPYRWCGAYLTDGPATRVHGRKVGTKWKPILLFGSPDRFLTQDVFTSNKDDKDHHHWGQSESGMADIVSRLTEPGDLVVDPFLGGGTTAVVCKALGRRFVGCDIDAAAVQTARERVA